jgi:hypothetical protein
MARQWICQWERLHRLPPLSAVLLALLACMPQARSAPVATVNSIADLELAMRDGATHIIIQNHLDAAAVKIPAVQASTMSIRVRSLSTWPLTK